MSISAGGNSGPSAIAFRYLQREALMSDPKWNNGHYYDGEHPVVGTQLARYLFLYLFFGVAYSFLRKGNFLVYNIVVLILWLGQVQDLKLAFSVYKGFLRKHLTKFNY